MRIWAVRGLEGVIEVLRLDVSNMLERCVAKECSWMIEKGDARAEWGERLLGHMDDKIRHERGGERCGDRGGGLRINDVAKTWARTWELTALQRVYRRKGYITWT